MKDQKVPSIKFEDIEVCVFKFHILLSTSIAMSSSLALHASASGTSGQMFLGELREGSTGPITVMVCRRWDVTSVNGRYMSTDYIVSDIKGGVMHCTARNNIAHYFFDKLKEGGVYLVKGFAVQPTNQYRVIKDNPFVIGLHCSTTVKKVGDDAGRFEHYPFLLTAFEDLEPTENKYFVDVIGYVTEVGAPSVKALGARTVEFNLTNERNRQVRVTLWGQLGDVLIQKKGENQQVYSVILTSMTAKFYLGTLSLSSSSSTMLIDSDEIPALQTFKASISCVAVGAAIERITEDVACVGTLTELLDKVRADKTRKKNTDFICCVEIKSVCNSDDWFRLTCGGGQCMKGVMHADGEMWCDGCENPVMFPRAGFRLELDVFDSTAEAVIVCFDDTARILTKTTAQSILNAESGVSHIYTVYAETIQDNFTPVLIQKPDGSISSLPNCLQSLVGTTQSILLDSCTYYPHGSFESFNCKHVFTDEDVCESFRSSSSPMKPRKPKGVIPIATPVKCKETYSKSYNSGSDSEDMLDAGPTVRKLGDKDKGKNISMH